MRFFIETFKNPLPNSDLTKEYWGEAIDVRDCSLQHILALESPIVGGERILTISTSWAWQDICEQVSSQLFNLTTSHGLLLEDDVLNAGGFPNVPKGDLGTGLWAQARASGKKVNVLSTAKSHKIFPGFEYRDLDTMLLDTSKQAAEQGWDPTK